MAKLFSSFGKALHKAKTEEEVKHAYAKHFALDYDTEFRHDLYSPEIFFEFKFQRSLEKRQARAAVLAQVMYYVRRLRLAAQKLDARCEELLAVAREIYKTFFKRFKDLPTSTFKVEHWDAGWYQVKRCLVEAGLERERLQNLDELKRPIGAAIAAEAAKLGIVAPA